jgi:hypothetical protein
VVDFLANVSQFSLKMLQFKDDDDFFPFCFVLTKKLAAILA